MWESPRGCLLFSYTIQMQDGKVVPFVQYVVSLAMTEAIKDLCQRNVSSFTQITVIYYYTVMEYISGLEVKICFMVVVKLLAFIGSN